jgi:hypothetical protein
MPKPNNKVFIQFNTEFVPSVAFILDDPLQGKLDGATNRLGGFAFVEVTPFLQSVECQRGKTRILDRFDAGLMNIQFDNSTRVFDPRFTGSPFFGAVLPRLNILVTSNDAPVYTGLILDWNIEYELGGSSRATAVCSDRFTLLTQTLLDEEFNDVQLSGDRILEILARPYFDFPLAETDIDTGLTFLQEDLIPENTDALSYFQLIERTEQGALFIAKDGKLTFKQRNTSPVLKASFSDDGTGAIPFTNIGVVFGSELLFNRIEVTPIGLDTEVADDLLSQAAFGLSVLAVETLHEFPEDAVDSALFLANQFSQPEYRFETLEIDLNILTSEQQNTLLDIELNDLVFVTFTPSGISPAIELGATVIGISHRIDVVQHFLTLNLSGQAGAPFVLDSPTLGVLDVDTLSY